MEKRDTEGIVNLDQQGTGKNKKNTKKEKDEEEAETWIGSRTYQVPYRTVPYRKPQPASQQASKELIYCLRNWSRGRSGKRQDESKILEATLVPKALQNDTQHMRKFLRGPIFYHWKFPPFLGVVFFQICYLPGHPNLWISQKPSEGPSKPRCTLVP